MPSCADGVELSKARSLNLEWIYAKTLAKDMTPVCFPPLQIKSIGCMTVADLLGFFLTRLLDMGALFRK